MNCTNPYSPVIERMRRARLTGSSGAIALGGTSSPTAPATLDPGLGQLGRKKRFLELLRTDDLTEVAAVLEDLQVLVNRCGYHRDSADEQRAIINRRAVRNSRAAQAPARRRGRRLGAQNFAARQFGLGLAAIWSQLTCCPPSRYEPRAYDVRGCYFEFVEMITEAVPPSARRRASTATHGADQHQGLQRGPRGAGRVPPTWLGRRTSLARRA